MYLLTGITISCNQEGKELELPTKEMPSESYSIHDTQGDFMGCVEVNKQTIEIELWDSTTPDRDEYILYLNDRQIHRGTTPPSQDRVTLTVNLPYFGYNRLAYYATRFGQLPHNSAIITVDGQKREVRSTYNKVGYLDIVFLKDNIICSSEQGNYTDLMFWSTSTTSHCTEVPVYLSGNGQEYESKVIGFFYNAVPDCGAVYCATFENLSAGTYTYRTGCDGSVRSTIELDGTPECRKINLFLL